MREENADLVDAHAALARSSAQSAAAQTSQITTLTHRAALLADELIEARETAEARSRTLAGVQEQLDELITAQDRGSRTRAAEDDMGVVRDELHRQATYLRSLEATNARLTAELNALRDRHTSIEVLREEKRGLERKVAVVQELRDRVVSLEAEVDAARREREEWYVVLYLI